MILIYPGCEMRLSLYLSLVCVILFGLKSAFANDISINLNSSDKNPQFTSTTQLNLASIELLIEQEIGRIVLPQIYKNIGINVEVTPLPGNRAQYLANSGMQDGEIMRISTYGNEALNTVRVPTPYYYLETTPFVLKNSDIVIKSKQDLAQYRVAKIRGVKHTNNITEGLIKLYDMSSTENMFKLLLSKKVDVVLTNTMDGNAAIARLGLQDMVEMKKPLARLPLYHYLHNKHDDLVPLIDREIKRLKTSREIETLINNAEKRVMNFH